MILNSQIEIKKDHFTKTAIVRKKENKIQNKKLKTKILLESFNPLQKRIKV